MTNQHENETNQFTRVRDQLRFWPYTLHQIDDTLDIGLIEGRGKQLLFRAVHSQNITAFAGSGLSMSYGRLSWREWVSEQQRVVKKNTRKFQEAAEASLAWNAELSKLLEPVEDDNCDAFQRAFRAKILDNDLANELRIEQKHLHNAWQWLKSRTRAIGSAREQIQRLSQTFELTQNDTGRFPGGEELPVKFEIAQQLHNQLQLHVRLFLPSNPQPGEACANAYLDEAWPSARTSPESAAPEHALMTLKTRFEKFRSEGKTKERMIRLYHVYQEKFKELHAVFSRPEAHQSFEELAKSLLVDECPHALSLLRQGLLKGVDVDSEDVSNTAWFDQKERMEFLEDQLQVFDTSNQKRAIDGIRENARRYRVLSPFKFDNFMKLREKLNDELSARSIVAGEKDTKLNIWLPFWHYVGDELGLEKKKGRYSKRVGKAGDKRKYITPSSRFLLPVCLSLFENPFDEIGIASRKDRKKGQGDPIGETFPLPEKADFTSRRSIIATRYDPLIKTDQDLGISRYITTNYDFEIERFYQDQGFRVSPSQKAPNWLEAKPDDDSFRLNNLGHILVDQSFKPQKSAELAVFSVADRSFDAGVYHLHGRATQDDQLVVTERDYMKLYLTQDENRDSIDEAINIAFAGSPLLFLGLGMEETDLLRPLRQFISNRDRTIGYTSIAILPADKALDARAKFSSALFLRYGVHTIFYGSGVVELGTRKQEFDWLYRINALINGLRTEVKRWVKDHLPTSDRVRNDAKFDFLLDSVGSEADIKPLRSCNEIAADLNESVGSLGDDLANPNMSESTRALNVLFGIDEEAFVADLGEKLREALAALVDNPDQETTWTLKTCRFTPAKPGGVLKADAHQNERQVEVDGEIFTGFYTRLLDRILKALMAMPEEMTEATTAGESMRAGKDLEQRKKVAAPFLIALDGLQGAFVTASLNAGIDLISKEKEQWWTNWKTPPAHRLAETQRRDAEGKALKGDNIKEDTLFVRHSLHNSLSLPQTTNVEDLTTTDILVPNEPGQPALLKPQFRTRNRAFDTFVAATACTYCKEEFIPDAGKRRIVTVAAKRGLGKGTFFSAFYSKKGRKVYKQAAWPTSDVRYVSRIFVNLGMSPEIASTYDMIVDAVIRSTAFIKSESEEGKKSQEKHCKEIRDSIENLSRLEEIRSVFRQFASVAKYRRRTAMHTIEKIRYRILLTFNAVDLLFDRMRRAKNGEIDRIIELLFSEDFANVPIDVIFLADDTCLGEPWALPQGEGNQMRVRLERDNLPEQADERIKRAINHSKIVLDRTELDRLPSKPPSQWTTRSKELRPEFHFVHYTRPVNAVWLMIDNFFVLGVAMYLLNPPDVPPRRLREAANKTKEVVWSAFDSAVRKGREDSDHEMDKLWSEAKKPDIPELDQVRAMVRDGIAGKIGKYLKVHSKVAAIHPSEMGENTLEALKEILRERLRKNTGDQNEWREIRRNLGDSRFALTVLLGAAEHMIVHSESTRQGAEAAQTFVRDTVSDVRGIGRDRRDQLVLNAVLDRYRQYHVIGNPDLDCELHMLILRHLAVIGTPVPSAVLVRLPDIRRYFETLGVEPSISRRRFLARALTTLGYRGLVFRLGPNPHLEQLGEVEPKSKREKVEEDSWPQAREYRYALHRVVQSFALESFKSSVADSVKDNMFAPSIYAVMPSSGPSLSRDTYSFLRRLIIGLSQYPDVPSLDTTLEPWLFSTRNSNVRAQALRAAMTLVRSTYSISVVSRLSDHQDEDTMLQKRGYMEAYKVRIRWIIRMAWELLDPTKTDYTTTPENQRNQIHALYRDEIVWLYNELGVVSLAQGSLSDALGYLRQAAEENERIEGGSPTMPVFNHIDINHAIVQLERGNFTSTRDRLLRIRHATQTRMFKLHFAARGYTCILDHIMGKRQGVGEEFQKVTEFFQEAGETRAVAIFKSHQARFLFEEDKKEALKLVSRARDLAETDGHEDIRYQIELAKVRIETDADHEKSSHSVQIRIIHETQEFARRMSIWSLQVDALRLKARLLLRQGETSSAGKFLIRAMAIARRNSMNLRLNSAMTSYAEVLHLRGDNEGAFAMAQASLIRAKRTSYSLETARAQEILRRCS